MPNKLQTCKVCGLFYPDFFPWGEAGDCASFDICDCCGTTFGYQDCSEEAIKEQREKWLKDRVKLLGHEDSLTIQILDSI